MGVHAHYANDKVFKIDSQGDLQLANVVSTFNIPDSFRCFEQTPSNLTLCWNNGLTEPLENQEIFTIDRPSLHPGSQVKSSDGSIGTVIYSKKLCTVKILDGSEQVVLDVPEESLTRNSLPGDIGDKIYYKGWIGTILELAVTVTYKIPSDGNTASVVQIGRENLVSLPPFTRSEVIFKHERVGETLKNRLTRADIWDAEWKEGYWLLNVIKYAGQKAEVVDIKLFSISVDWWGPTFDYEFYHTNPKVQIPSKYHKNEPPTILDSENLRHIQFIGTNTTAVDENCFRLTNELKLKNFVTMDYSSWLKKLGNPETCGFTKNDGDCVKFQCDSAHELRVQVLMTRTIVGVLWEKNSTSYHYAKDLIPVESELPVLTSNFCIGDIVNHLNRKNSTSDPSTKHKSMEYGMVINISGDIVDVQWIVWDGKTKSVQLELETGISKHDIYLKPKFQYLREIEKRPVVIIQENSDCQKLSTNAGVAVGFDLETAKIFVQIDIDCIVELYAHEIHHFPHDRYYDTIEKEFIPWEHCTCCRYEVDEARDACVGLISRSDPVQIPGTEMQPLFVRKDSLSEESYFYGSPFLPRIYESKFMISLERQLSTFQQGTAHVHVEAYLDRCDVLSAVIKGSRDTPYENHLLLFDIQLMEDYPESAPKIVFYTMGMEVNPCFEVGNGFVTLPPGLLHPPEEYSILDFLKYIRDKILVEEPYYLKSWTKGKIIENSIELLEGPSDIYNNLVTLNMMSYTEMLILNVPRTWRRFILDHYKNALPKIIMSGEHYVAKLRTQVAEEEKQFIAQEKDPNASEFLMQKNAFIASISNRLMRLKSIRNSTCLHCT